MRALEFVRSRKNVICTVIGLVALLVYAASMLERAAHDLFTHASLPRHIGDGTDMRVWPWQNRVILRTLREHPGRLFFGAIYTDLRNAPLGFAMWTTWIERILVPLFAPFTNDSTMGTALDLAWLVGNGAAMMWYGRVVRWPWLLSIGAALAFAVTPYTRARASVHGALVAVYFIPLIFGALELLARHDFARPRQGGPIDKRIAQAALAFFVSATSAHYYVIIAMVSTPLFAIYFWQRAGTFAGGNRLRKLGALALASIPALALCAWTFLMPVAPKIAAALGRAYPEANRAVALGFLQASGAHPIDYLSGDVKFGLRDVIAKRVEVTQWVVSHLDGSNYHERANGIRWTILAICMVAMLALLKHAFSRTSSRAVTASRQLCWLGLLIALYAFFFSLSPRGLTSYGEELGPSLFANRIFANFRVPNRFGPMVNFGAIVLAAEFIASLAASTSRALRAVGQVASAALTFGTVAEYRPLNPMLMAPMRPVRTELIREGGNCGMGIILPFGTYDYWALEETRGTRCTLLYPADVSRSDRIEASYGYQYRWGQPREDEQFAGFARCTGIDWILFRVEMPAPARKHVCDTLGWTMLTDLTCRAPQIAPQKRLADACL